MGAVFTDQPILQPLADVFLHFHPTDDFARLRLERFILAIRTTASTLEKIYTDMDIAAIPTVGSPIFPYKTSYSDAAASVRTFKYTRAFSDDMYVYFATADSRERVVVKFIKPGQYSETAINVHRFATANGFAPSVLAVERMPAGWVMIIMQDLSDRYHQFVRGEDSTSKRPSNEQLRP